MRAKKLTGALAAIVMCFGLSSVVVQAEEPAQEISYEEFKKVTIKQEEDLKSQIYVNSKIATEKYNNYNKGLSWFKIALFTAGLLFLAVMFLQ